MTQIFLRVQKQNRHVKKRKRSKVIGTCVDVAEGEPDHRGLCSPTLKNIITEPSGVKTAMKRLKSRLSVIYARFRVLIGLADAGLWSAGRKRGLSCNDLLSAWEAVGEEPPARQIASKRR